MENKRAIVASILFSVTHLGWSAESTLCEAEEKIVWSCHTAKKTYSVCASPNLSRSSGYLQYRVGQVTKTEFVYPATRVHPLEKFSMTMGPHGASLEFANGRFRYSIAEEARGLPLIFVAKDEQQVAIVHCKDLTGGLLDNATLDLLRAAGIAR